MRKLSLLLCVVLLLVSLSACKEGKTDPYVTDSSVFSELSEPSEQRILCLPYGGGILDPLCNGKSFDQAVDALIAEPLCRLSAGYEAELCLADSVRVSDCAIDIVLKDGVAFHDGSALTAEDAVYSVERIYADGNSPYHGLLSDMDSVRVTSTLSLQIVMTHPVTDPFDCLCFPIVKKGTGVKSDAVGTGAYAVTSSEGKKLLRGTKNGLLFPEIGLISVSSAQEARTLFENGDVDSMCIDFLTSEKISPVCKYQTVNVGTGVAHLLGFSCHSKTLTPEIRRAIGAILPRKEICTGVLCGSVAASSDWLCPEGNLKIPDSAETDKENAEALLKKCNELQPLQLRLLYCDDHWVRTDEALFLKQLLESYGFECILSACDGKQYNEAIYEKKFDLCLIRSSLFTPGDITDLVSSGGKRNIFSYANPLLDTVLMSYMISDTDLQTETGRELGQYLSEDMPFSVIGYEQTTVFIREDSLFSFDPTPGRPYGDPAYWSRISERS